MKTAISSLSLLCLALNSPAALAGDVLEVGPGRPLSSIQQAIDLAAPGDLLLVDSGTYAEDLVIDVGVAITGRTSSLTIDGHVDIGPLPGDQAVVLYRLNLTPDPDSPTGGGLREAVHIENCRGAVRFNDVTVITPAPTAGGSAPGIVCARANNVVFDDCSIQGGLGNGLAFNLVSGGTGLRIEAGAVVEVDGCSISGGEGSSGFNGGNGAPAARVATGGRFFASRSTITGGAGGRALDFFGGDGAPGLVTLGGSSTELQDMDITGGFGGTADFGFPGDDGAPILDLGPVVQLPGSPRFISIPGLQRVPAGAWGMVCGGLEPSETAQIWFSERSAPRFLTPFEKPLRIFLDDPATFQLPPIAANNAGLVGLSFTNTTDPTGDEDVQVLWTQALCVEADGTTRLSTSRATIFLANSI